MIEPSPQAWTAWFRTPETQAVLLSSRTRYEELIAKAIAHAVAGEDKLASSSLLRAKSLAEVITTIESKNESR